VLASISSYQRSALIGGIASSGGSAG
jgi:hypothetical protein